MFKVKQLLFSAALISIFIPLAWLYGLGCLISAIGWCLSTTGEMLQKPWYQPTPKWLKHWMDKYTWRNK